MGLGLEHDGLSQFFRLAQPGPPAPVTRSASRRHAFQVVDLCREACQDYLLRSILGMTHVYNLLPEDIVRIPSVSLFQRALTDLSRADCRLRGIVDENLF